MRQQLFKNLTFSLPIEISLELHSLIKRREMSRFVADAIRVQLETKKQNLRNAYIEANVDPGQVDAKEDWKETLLDGVDGW